MRRNGPIVDTCRLCQATLVKKMCFIKKQGTQFKNQKQNNNKKQAKIQTLKCFVEDEMLEQLKKNVS